MYEDNYHGYANQNRKKNIACNSWANLLAVRLPRFVMCQDVFLRLAVQHVNIVVCQVDNSSPQTARINYHRGG